MIGALVVGHGGGGWGSHGVMPAPRLQPLPHYSMWQFCGAVSGPVYYVVPILLDSRGLHQTMCLSSLYQNRVTCTALGARRCMQPTYLRQPTALRADRSS